MKAKVVIGAGYGDEGKGVFTNYLSSLTHKSMVVRFNGGAQAGHTVFNKNGLSHVFGHFTANSFLPESRGYLSKHFIINPIVYLNELSELDSKGINPIIAAHEDCYLTTPYDMLINRWLERSRGENGRHGSCGLGIGETIHRCEVADKPLRFKDTESLVILRDKLIIISHFFEKRVRELGLEKYYKEMGFFLHEKIIDQFIEDIIEMKKTLIYGVNSFSDKYFSDYDIIFEGAQGLMLDQNMGDFPHVTRSNTGLKNVIQICIENNINEIEVLYATRCYRTRHGAGSLKHELTEKPYPNIIDKTNIPNEHQGSIRFAYLDIDELFSYIQRDFDSVHEDITLNQISVKRMIGVSCLDQTEDVFYYQNDILHSSKNVDFDKVIQNQGFPVITHYSHF